MDATALVAKIESRFTLEDVQNNQVETISVVAMDELDSLIQQAVNERTSELELELQQAREQLANMEDGGSGGGGLEAAAADAAMEAEARALEEKAEAEQRASEAQKKVLDLEAKLATAEAEAGKLGGLQSEIDKLKKELDGGNGEDDDDSPVTDDERKKAGRLAEAFLDDVFSDDEDKTNKAIKDGKFREVFASEIKSAHRKYVKRVRAAVRADAEFWDNALKAGESKEW